MEPQSILGTTNVQQDQSGTTPFGTQESSSGTSSLSAQGIEAQIQQMREGFGTKPLTNVQTGVEQKDDTLDKSILTQILNLIAKLLSKNGGKKGKKWVRDIVKQLISILQQLLNSQGEDASSASGSTPLTKPLNVTPSIDTQSV